MSVTMTDSEIKNKIHWAIEQTVCIDDFEKKHWHKEIEVMSREQLIIEYKELEKNGWFS